MKLTDFFTSPLFLTLKQSLQRFQNKDKLYSSQVFILIIIQFNKTATLTPEMKSLKFNGKDPHLYLPPTQTNLYATPPNLIQKYLLLPSQVRDAYLCHLFTTTLPPSSTASAIVFVNKCSTAERLRLMLMEMGVKCTGLHAKMDQKERIGSLAKFRSLVVPVLITTDVGSRFIYVFYNS